MYALLVHFKVVMDRVQNSLGLTLQIDFGFGFNGFEKFKIFRAWVHWVCENLAGSGRVFGSNGFRA